MRQERGDDVIVALVGNKTDLAEKRRVTREEGEAFAAQQKILFVGVCSTACQQLVHRRCSRSVFTTDWRASVERLAPRRVKHVSS